MTDTASFRWTPEQDEALRLAWRTSETLMQMEHRLGKTKNSIASRARRLGLPFRNENKSAPWGMKDRRAEHLDVGQNLPRRERSCCFPLGDPGTPTFAYCGAPVAKKDYCQTHYDISYTAPRKRSDPKPEQKSDMVWSNLLGRAVPRTRANFE